MQNPSCRWLCCAVLVLGLAVVALPAAAHQHEGEHAAEKAAEHAAEHAGEHAAEHASEHAAQELPFTPEEAAAWQKAMTPGEEHERLASQTGNWKFTGKFWSDPETEPTVTEGTAKRHTELGDRVLVETIEADFMGSPFQGIGRTGYDNVTGKYWTTWTDTMSTGVMVMHGAWNEEKGGVVFEGSHPDPLHPGATVEVKSVVKNDGDHESADFWEKHDGEWVKTMELHYTRE